jgi:hypothetical protein
MRPETMISTDRHIERHTGLVATELSSTAGSTTLGGADRGFLGSITLAMSRSRLV